MSRRTRVPAQGSYNCSSTGWLFGDVKASKWTQEENKMFETGLALHDKDTPDRWIWVAAMIPGKTVCDVIEHYRELEEDISDIEAGLIPIPGYTSSAFTLEWADNEIEFDDPGDIYTPGAGGKRSSSARGLDQERKKGVPWTEEEHRQFLLGLNKYGKGDWRNISHHFVMTRTPTQVASHAQKFFLRQVGGPKDKRRSSIHDITTVTSSDDKDPSTSSSTSLSPDRRVSDMQLLLKPDLLCMANGPFEWTPRNGGDMFFNQSCENSSVEPPCDMFSSGLKLQYQSMNRGGVGGSQCEPYNTMFQMQSRKKK